MIQPIISTTWRSFFTSFLVFLAAAAAAAANAAATATVVHVSVAAATALRNEPAEGAAGGEDAHSASRH